MGKLPAGDWLTVAEVAGELGVTTRRVQVLIKDGRLPATRIGQRVLMVLRKDVESFRKVKREPGRPKKGKA